MRVIKEHREAVFLFILAFLARAVYALFCAWSSADSNEYLNIARVLDETGNFAFYINGELHLTARRPLLLPLILSFFFNAKGEFPATGFVIFQSLTGAATVALVYLWTFDITKEKRTALFAAAILAFAPFTIHWTVIISTETLFTFLTFAGAYLYHRKLSVPSGLILGLAILTRPVALVLVGVLFLFELKRNARCAALLLAACAVLPLAWTARNTLLFERFTFVQSEGFGTNLLCGTVNTPPQVDLWQGVHAAVDFTPRAVNEPAEDKKRMSRAVEIIKADPFAYLAARARQYPHLFYESGGYLVGESNYLLKIVYVVFGYALFYVLALIGFWYTRGGWLNLTMVWLFPVVLAAMHVPMWIETRYFLPAMPFLCVLAGIGLERIKATC